MNGHRHQGYLAARGVIEGQPLDPFAAELLLDLAERLLLARVSEDAAEARDAVVETVDALVVRNAITRRTASRVWVHLKACGPPMHWPTSWDRAPVPFSGFMHGR